MKQGAQSDHASRPPTESLPRQVFACKVKVDRGLELDFVDIATPINREVTASVALRVLVGSGYEEGNALAREMVSVSE